MGTINFPGLSSGLDTAKIIEQLMEANSAKLKLMKANLATEETKKTAYSDLQSSLASVKTAVSALDDSSALKSFKAVTSDLEIMTAEASSDAYEGNHSIKIKQLATAERWVHNGVSNSTAYVGAGNFIFSYNNKELIIQTTDTTTLDDMVGLINNDTNNPGVTASVLKYDSGSGNAYHLVLSGKESGSDYQIVRPCRIMRKTQSSAPRSGSWTVSPARWRAARPPTRSMSPVFATTTPPWTTTLMSHNTPPSTTC
jgi:flagellar hook-associated protein 2